MAETLLYNMYDAHVLRNEVESYNSKYRVSIAPCGIFYILSVYSRTDQETFILRSRKDWEEKKKSLEDALEESFRPRRREQFVELARLTLSRIRPKPPNESKILYAILDFPGPMVPHGNIENFSQDFVHYMTKPTKVSETFPESAKQWIDARREQK